MKRKCEYCGVAYEDSLPACPQCSAPNEYRRATGIGVPKTVEELAQWYAKRNLPPEEVTRFFIGKDVREPRAFGIYQDGEDFIVYKNRANGERFERYRGTDEAYAVNELYLKLKEEILTRKSIQSTEQDNCSGEYTPPEKKGTIFSDKRAPIIIAFFLIFIAAVVIDITNDNGYYRLKGNTYYNDSNDWYIWDTDGWHSTTKPDFGGSSSKYKTGYDENQDYEDFFNSRHYYGGYEFYPDKYD